MKLGYVVYRETGPHRQYLVLDEEFGVYGWTQKLEIACQWSGKDIARAMCKAQGGTGYTELLLVTGTEWEND